MSSDTETPELFIMVFADGPYPGAYEAPAVLSWPLPDRIKGQSYSQGCYVKAKESGSPANLATEARGAMYTWDNTAIYDPRRDGV
jgi:hypothetical protein